MNTSKGKLYSLLRCLVDVKLKVLSHLSLTHALPLPLYRSHIFPGPLASLWQEYARADTRWGTSDPTVVSIEIITVLMAGPLCVVLMDMMRKQNEAWRYWM